MKIRKKKSGFRDTLEAVFVAFLIAMVIRTFAIQAFKIPTGSMIPTLLIGDHLLVNKIVLGTPIDIPFTNIHLFDMPGLRKPQKGDIIVFKYPKNPSRDFIKRVIAAEGDTIESKKKVIFVNGHKLIESYTHYVDDTFLDNRDSFGPLTIPAGKVFVMGDNRDQSSDSRYWGFVDASQIKGKAMIIYFSWNGKDTSLFNKIRFNRLGRLIQ